MSMQNNRHKGYYEIGLTYINHRIKVRVFNGETFNSLLHRLFFILSIEREDHLFALKKAESNKLICNNDELTPEDFYQLVVVDDDRQEEVTQFQSPATEDQVEEPGSVRSKKGTSECRNRTYHGFSINQCYYKSKRPKDETKLLYCPFLSCLKEFSETGNLKTHMRTHTGERPFVCQFEDCGKGFITKGHLKTHLLIHSGEKPFACNFPGCNKQYSRSGRLKIHMRTHTGEKPYVCSFSGCSKSFTEKGNLKTHMRIHSGQKPYFCDFDECNKSFTTQGHLTDHKRRHYGDRPFRCEACERTFMRSSTLKKHQEKHKGKCCDISHDDSSFMETYSQAISTNMKECSHYNERNNSSGEEENSHYDPREESKDLSNINKNERSKLRINKDDSLPLSKYNEQRNEGSSNLKGNLDLKEFNINFSQKESNFKNPFETKDVENVSKNDDPFAPNPTLSITYSGSKSSMKDPFNTATMKDPFNMPAMKDPFNMPTMKDPFSGENQKNSFETNCETK